jgi:anti-anti-sigma factor
MTSPYQQISVHESRGVLILAIELKRVATYELAQAMGYELIDAVQQKRAPKVVVDLGKLEYMSSVGYGPLISLRSRVGEADGRLILCRLSPVVQEMFEATRLLINPRSPLSLFQFTDTLDSAVAILSGHD